MKSILQIFPIITFTMLFAACEQEPKKQPEPELPKIATPELNLTNYNANSFLVEWDAIEGAGAYAYSLDGSSEMTISETRVAITNLETKSYHLKVKAISEALQMADSEYAELTIELKHKTDSNVQKWLGTWKATFNKSVKWSDKENEDEVQLLEDDFHSELTVTEDIEIPNGVLITGWYPLSPETPAKGTVMADGTLYLCNGVVTGETTQDGTPTWISFCTSGSSFGFISGADLYPYSITIREDGSALGIVAKGTLTTGQKYEVLSLGIYNILDNGRIRIPYYGESYVLPAGAVQMTKL